MIGRWAKKLMTLFTGADPATWAGHALQGFLLGFVLAFIDWTVALVFVTGAFWHRELSDFTTPVYRGILTWRGSWRKVKRDGLPDFLLPIFAAGLGIGVQFWIFG